MNQQTESSAVHGAGDVGNGSDRALTQEYAHHAGEAFGQIKTVVSSTVRSAASSLHRTDNQVGDREEGLSGYGHQAATWLERSADYIEEFEPEQVVNQLRQEVRRNPGRSLLIAGAAGLVLGVLFRRR